jgi:predicted AlkP superfamily phosphohydrolase/phosphomutase
MSLGKFIIPLSRARVRLLRKSEPFWRILGRYGIFSTIIRVPISYPPEKFFGNILSAMCTPDLRGTQGTFTVFTSDHERARKKSVSGDFRLVAVRDDGSFQASLDGPTHPYRKDGEKLCLPFVLRLHPEHRCAELEIAGERYELLLNQFSPWVVLPFSFGFGQKVSGICRFCLRQVFPAVELYVSPINVNPERPALPISSPLVFSSFLAKRQGLYGTIGFMEDTWGRNEEALDDERFLAQTYLTHAEREEMFFQALELTRVGVCACVFDASDRIQHMFWRYLDDSHPAPREDKPGREHVVREMYEKMDSLVGRVLEKLRDGDVLFVMSDHGFTSFRRCVNLNTWLFEQGYLVSKSGELPERDYFRDVDWGKTKAFAVGLSGIYLNRRGRERLGIVAEEDVEPLKSEIRAGLQALKDPESGQLAVRRVYDTKEEYRGLYTEDAPDLVLGFERGYRTSWESVVGGCQAEVFQDNLKAWSGDHDVDPELVPGVLFSNRKLNANDAHIRDLAPTILDLFAVPRPSYLEGKVLL